MKNFLGMALVVLGCSMTLFAADQEQEIVAGQGGLEAQLTAEQEIRKLQQEQVELVKTIRTSNDRAMQDRRAMIATDPELAKLQTRIADLERQLKATRDELQAKMAAAGMKATGAPQASLDGMAKLRAIEARLRELAQQPEQEQPVKPEAPAPGVAEGGAATQE